MRQYKVIIMYLFFGGCTTLVNILLYALCYEGLSWGNVYSTCLAWIGAVLFAYISNKLWVFESRDMTPRTILKEWNSFLLCRVATGVLDVSIMYVAVDLLSLMPLPWKLVANIIVIIANWLVSKNYIFSVKNNESM